MSRPHRLRRNKTGGMQRTSPARYFLFVGEAGSCLGGIQDYYGAYNTPAAARHAVPEGVDWAEIAAVRDGGLVVVATGQRHEAAWRWRDLDQENGTTAASAAPTVIAPEAA